MDAGSEGEAPARDPASLQRVELVRVASADIEKVTPELTSSAQVRSTHFTEDFNQNRGDVSSI